ncbi:GNAT family N-acetyltransferase [Halostella sp. JP-L12]|uniref:GNAT family N-acetyltransferase n=1 Tax=Halostella TaxID=1843185 RepID=UPI000EF7E22C|nr:MULTISPECIES: GNAT family protein [Halostella]NHN47718.1 GNAT family N-acetyltransferase [Halostella sp. JP-L12]
MPGPVIEAGERVALRTIERDDAAFLQRSNTDPRVRFLLGSFVHGNHAERREQVEEVAEGEGTRGFVACLDDPDAPAGHPGDATTPIGAVHAYGVDGERAWISYWLLPEHQGHGYGREAAELLVDLVFRESGVHGVSAGAYAHNDASRGVLESLGFTQDVRERKVEFADGAYRDACTYSLLRREWRS